MNITLILICLKSSYFGHFTTITYTLKVFQWVRDGLFPGPELPTTRKMLSAINYSDNFQQFHLFIIIHQIPHCISLYKAFMEKTVAFQLVCNYTESFPLAGRNFLERLSTLLNHQNLGYLLICPLSKCLAGINRH